MKNKTLKVLGPSIVQTVFGVFHHFALARELDEELGIKATIGQPVTRIRHNYRHGGAVDLQFFAVREFAGEIINHIYHQFRWVRLEDLSSYEFLAADRNLIRDLAAGKLL